MFNSFGPHSLNRFVVITEQAEAEVMSQ